MTASARLTWQTGAFLPPDDHERLLGPGAPHELVIEDVLGEKLPVFARRPPHLRALLDRTVARQPDDTYLVSPDRQWTFAEAATEIDAIAALLAGRYEIRPGDRVGIVAANSAEYGLVMWAVLSIGAVITSLNGWWTGPELRYGIELATPSLIAGDDRRLARLPADAVPDGVPVVTLDALVAEARLLEDPTPPASTVGEDDPAVILFTSGTTGRPKGATLSHRNIVNFASVTALSIEIGKVFAPPGAVSASPSQPASILSSPMFHVSGMLGILMSGPVLGSKLVFAPAGRWDETRHLELTVEHGISTWSGVPTQFWRLLRHPDLDSYDLSSVKTVGGGGAPFPPELTRALTERFEHVSLGNGYGMSETVGLGTITGGPLMVARPEAVGPAQPGTEVEIRDPAGRLLVEGEVGEIHLRNASVFLGYWNNPEATAEAFAEGRWYRTGDFGRIVDGMLVLESRARDLILRGGENIYPLEIEHRLVEHPDVDDVAVIGVDHLELGQEVKAFVVPRAGSDLTAGDVQRWAAEALATYKVPTYVAFRDALPYTDTGKVLKQELEREERARAEGAGTVP
ncbi:class I adenylate-forming enzyme family protein [soil metagenome]